jgi:hypothetical protein
VIKWFNKGRNGQMKIRRLRKVSEEMIEIEEKSKTFEIGT